MIAPTSKFSQFMLMMKISRFVHKTYISREVRETARGCKLGGKDCRRKLRQEKKKNKRNRRKGNKSKTKKSKKAAKKNMRNRRKVKKSKTKKSKKTAKNADNVEKKKLTRNLNRKMKQRKQPKETKKIPKKKSRKDLRKETKWFGATTTPTKILRQGQCFTDIVAKSKKFNKAQVEFRLANRIDR